MHVVCANIFGAIVLKPRFKITVALLEKRRFLYNHSGDFPQVILIIPSHVPNTVCGVPGEGSVLPRTLFPHPV